MLGLRVVSTFVLGAAVGSFLNVLADRVPHGLSPLWGRSACDHCRRKLAPRDLVPIVSWLWLRGRCRFCGGRISWQYPLVELVSGLWFLVAALSASSVGHFLFLAVWGSVFLVLFVTDLKYGLIPDKIVIPGIILTLGLGILSGRLGISGMLAGLLVVAFFGFLIGVTRGRGMGGGDLRLGFLVGLVSGWPKVLLAVFLAFILGAVVSLGLLALKKKKFGQTVPFGPFLIAATLVSYFASVISCK